MDIRILLLVAIFMFFVTGNCNAAKARAFFVFGDSYADTGNLKPNGVVSAWNNPYGVSWPGHPIGRFSSGRIQTDYIAQILGLPSPIPYGLLKNSKNSTIGRKGMNFAVAGSGVFDTFGFSNLTTQVKGFKDVIRSHKYGSHHLKRSVVLLSIEGNDYAFVNLTAVGMKKFAKSVITAMQVHLRELYNLGLRNFLLSNAVPFDCLPSSLHTGATCLNTTMKLVYTHNKYLTEAVSELRELKHANFLILDFFAAFTHIVSNPSAHGIEKMNTSCCSPKTSATLFGCGEYDEKGKSLYHLCKHPEKYFFFDWYHPTQKGWEAMVDLYYSHQGFVQDGTSSSSTSLAEWLHSRRVGLHSSPPIFSTN